MMNNMINIISSEYQKYKRTFTKKLIYLAPLLTMSLCILLGTGAFLQNGTYNWWYTIILPGVLPLICGEVIKKDKNKVNYRGVLTLPVATKKIWYGKIAVTALFYLIASAVLFLGLTLGGLVFGNYIPVPQSFAGSIVLFLTFLWQIPLCLFISQHFTMYGAVILNFGCNMAIATFLAKTSLWWVPYAIPARLMCPIMGVLPNGLMVEAGSPLLSPDVILPGIIINLTLFTVLSIATARAFNSKGVK